MKRHSERGIALVVVMFMVLLLSMLGSSLIFVSRAETLSSLNYKTMSQSRYAAESGVHSAANHLLNTYVPPGTPGAAIADPLANYDITVSPVRFNGQPVVLSSDPNRPSNYPIAQVRDAFVNAAQGVLTLNNAAVNFNARATLVSMRQITDDLSKNLITLQTWEITGNGFQAGAANAQIEVTAIIESKERPIFAYAAFATDTGCTALKFGGGADTNSYLSRDDGAYTGPGGKPALDNFGGNVGTNGNLDEIGNTTNLHGSLSTPRVGVGNCTANNVTALTVSGGATLDDGLVELPQTVTYPNPPPINPAPPTNNEPVQKNNGCPGGLVAPTCTAQANQGSTIHPATAATVIRLGDVSLTGGATLHLGAGIYEVNSLSVGGNSTIILDSGPVIFRVQGEGVNTPIDFTGGSFTNGTYDPSMMQFIYGGTGTVKMVGGSSSAALVYAPNASGQMAGGTDFYGAIVANKITDMGGASIHYDRRLQKKTFTAGPWMMSSFSWKTY